MNHHDEPTTNRTTAKAYESPVLIPIGDVENVVLGIPWGGDEYFGFTPPRFEFQEDHDDEDGAPRAQVPPR